MFKVPESKRKKGTPGDEGNGIFMVPHPKIQDCFLLCIASDGEGWEHVSISLQYLKRKVERCPNWDEMCYIKNLFWGEDDAVIQFHPPKSEYVNLHKYCLHLWRPTTHEIIVPEKILVGF